MIDLHPDGNRPPTYDREHFRAIRPAHPDQAALISPRLSPRSPDYAARMQPPEPDNTTQTPQGLWVPGEASPPPLAAPPAATGGARVVISFGPHAGLCIISIEREPDWDVADDETWVVERAHVPTLIPILRRLAKLKDLTGGAWRPRPQAVTELLESEDGWPTGNDPANGDPGAPG